ncbi:hypothetical protein N657DRAFT_645708 [Parathielavia appendiculata]|uniref:Uncharacterized protein n=1 Tax=Parathielavia appendiculata TaxID=2587402 RepID=A0AAN6TZG5_9PEZI|nr:hypothetical protein N657DRAFT_645708 [Parathielavia appendiculata]
MYIDIVDLDSGRIVQNHSLALIESQSQMLVYPGGSLYPVFIGCLSVGSPDPQQVFASGVMDRPSVNASKHLRLNEY